MSQTAGPGRSYDVVLTSNYSPWSRYSGGGQKSVHMVASALARQGLKVAVLYSTAPWEKVDHPPLPYDVRWACFFGLKPGISSPFRFLNGLSFLFAARRLAGPGTVLHGNGDEASLLWMIRRKRRFVFTNRYPEFPAFLHGSDWTRPATWLRVFFREPRFLALALAIRFCDDLTVTSASSLRQVAESFGSEAARRGRVVPNGVDPVALETPLREGKRTGVLFFGRLTRAKGADLALEAYARLPAALRSKHPFRILGSGPLRADLEKRAGELGVALEFAGWASGDGLAQAIQMARVVCLPSREESFGNTVAETLALGRPLVTSRAGSIPEVAGEFGRQVAEERAEAYAEALRLELETEESPENGARQREFIRSRYSWEKTAEKFREIYGSGS